MLFFPLPLFIALKKEGYKLGREGKKREGGRKRGREKGEGRQRGGQREEPLPSGTLIIHVDVNISTKTGSRKIPLGSL